jgi:hypothetical protein
MNPDKENHHQRPVWIASTRPLSDRHRLPASPCSKFTELRSRLSAGWCQLHRREGQYAQALTETGMPDIGADLVGQMAYVMGEAEVFTAAKGRQNFEKNSEARNEGGHPRCVLLDAAALQSIADIRPAKPSFPTFGDDPQPATASPASSKRTSGRRRFGNRRSGSGWNSSAAGVPPAASPVAEAEAPAANNQQSEMMAAASPASA